MVQLKHLPRQSDLLANCRALAYRLYNHCEKTKQAEEGRAYNGLVIAWQEIERQASNQPTETAVQASLI
jgi:putative DNA methylase